MAYAILDDAGNIRGMYAEDDGLEHAVEGEAPRRLTPIPKDDPRVLAITNPERKE